MHHTLLILDYYYPYIGWIETLFGDVAEFCSKKKMKITIVTSRHHPQLKKIEKRWDVVIYRVGKNRITLLPSVLWFALTNRDLIRSIDHIHTSTFVSALPAWIIGKIWKKPLTITIHEIYDTLRYHLKGSWWRFYIRFETLVCYLPWKKIITVSQASKTLLQKTYPHLRDDNLEVILNQIDTNFWNKNKVTIQSQHELLSHHFLTQKEKILIFVGRLWYEKWLPYLLEAFSGIKDNDQYTKLILIAPRSKLEYKSSIQDDIDTTRKQMKNNYLTKHIVWIDPVKTDEELRLWMSIAHVGIVPSMSEGFCYTAVQMQAMGLRMIASQVGALPEVLDHTTTDFVSYGKVQELTDTLVDVLSNIDLWKHKNPQAQKSIDYTAYYNLFFNK